MNSLNSTDFIAFLLDSITTEPSSPSPNVIYEWFCAQTNPPYMIVTYLSMAIFGVLGNIVTCIVIVTNRSMHTVTNCYLFNLAVSDLIMLFFSYPPLDGYTKYNSEFICVFRVGLYCSSEAMSRAADEARGCSTSVNHFPPVGHTILFVLPGLKGCSFVHMSMALAMVSIIVAFITKSSTFGDIQPPDFFRGLLAECSVYVSVLTISAFSVERYLAICHPFRARALSRLSRIPIVILLIWLLGIACALPIGLQLSLYHHDECDVCTRCTFRGALVPRMLELSSLVFFVLPMPLIGWLYAMIGLKLRKSGRMEGRMAGDGEAAAAGDARPNGNKKRVFRMLVTVVAAFFICWAPFHVQRLILIDFNEIFQDRTYRLDVIIYHISAVFSYSSAVINPILYNIMSNKFRRAFEDTIARGCRIFRFT